MIFFLFFSFFAQATFAYDLPPILGMPGSDKTVTRFSEISEPTKNSTSTNNQTGIEEHNLYLYTPVSVSDKNQWTIFGKSQWMELHTNAVLPSGVALPDNLWDNQFGVSYLHQLGDDKSWGLSTSFGSASDKPFASSQVDTIGAMANYSFKESERSRWILFLNYSNNRAFLNNIPIPGFAYVYTPSPYFDGVFGVPFFFLNWRPEGSDWSYSANAFFPHFGKIEADYALKKPLSLFASLEISGQSFLRLGRTDSTARLVYLEDRALVGAKTPLSTVLFAELGGGVAFKRSFYEAESFSDRGTNTVAIASGLLFSASLSARF